MKKLHILVMKAFLGRFLASFVVLEVAFLVHHMVKYKDDFAGKGIGMEVYTELAFYFSFFVLPVSLPMGILLSSLIAYGSLGEHKELTAIKTAGVNLVRTLTPTFLFVLLATSGLFYVADQVIPRTNLKAWSLLWDATHKNPAFQLKEGEFYNGLEGYSIKVGEKRDNGRIKDILIYDHTSSNRVGNREVISADSGRMYTILDDSYLKLELFNGVRSAEYSEEKKANTDDYSRMEFVQSTYVFDLGMFELQRTPEEQFSNNKLMLTPTEIQAKVDTIANKSVKINERLGALLTGFYKYGFISPKGTKKGELLTFTGNEATKKKVLRTALNLSRRLQNDLHAKSSTILNYRRSSATFMVEKVHTRSRPFSCLIMFIMGASLGVVIKKGGIGLPALITFGFFILFYVLSITFEKYAQNDQLDPVLATWMSNIVLIPVALFFMIQAYRDTRIF